MLDTIHRIETPEGVDLDLRLAGPVVRAVAWVIDFLLRVVMTLVLAIPLAMLGYVGIGLLLILSFLLEWIYPVLFEVLSQGSTPGKKLLRLQVVHRDGTPVGWTAAVLRNLLRAADFLPAVYGVGLVSMLFGDGFQRLGDLAAGTLVVHREAQQAHTAVPAVDPLPSPLPLRLEEQRAIIGFAQRAPQLPPARAEELAAVVEPLAAAHPLRVEDRVLFLTSIAAWLVGRRNRNAGGAA